MHQYPYSPGQHHPPPRRSRRVLIAILVTATVVVVAVAAVVIVLVRSPDGIAGEATGDSPASSARRNRPTVPGATTRAGDDQPGKQVFLTHEPGAGPPFRLGATAAYDACTVLPVSAIREVGIELDPYYQVTHEHMERDAPGDPSLAHLNIEGLSNCTWPGADDEWAILLIYQSPYSHDRDRTIRLEQLGRRGASEESVRGLRVFTVHPKDDPTEWQVSLFADNYWASLLLKTKRDSYKAGSPQDVITALTDVVAANLERGPTGPATLSYGDGPYAGFPEPCALFTREDFKLTHGVDDVGRVSRGLTGGDQLLTGDRGERARYIRITCARKALGKQFEDLDAPGLEVEFNVYPDAEQAAFGEFVTCDPTSGAAKVFGPPLAVSAKIGDGRVCMPNEGRPNRRLVFRVGRTEVYLHNWLYADAADLNALAAKLTPAAQAIAARLPR